jgi:signal transduction histidine kinase
VKSLVQRIARLPSWVADGLLALCLLLAEVPLLWVYDPQTVGIPGYAGPTPLAVALIVAMCLPLTWRRRAPVLVLLASTAFGLLTIPAEVPSQLFAPLIACYTVASRCARRTSLVAWVLISIGVVLLVGLLEGPDAYGSMVTSVVVAAGAFLLGDAQRARQARAALLAERAEGLLAERERSAELAVAEERARIARELHDVVAHTVSVMVVQAAAARRVLPTDAERARAAAQQVATTGRHTLAELRRLLGVLHEDGAPASRAPQPDLDDLDDLVAQFAGTPLRVRLRTSGARRRYSPGVELSAYRIVQESLTNALRHSGGARVEVHVGYRADGLAIEVVDDGPAGSAPDRSDGGGHGLVGMRERASLIGGSLQAGPRPGGGYAVTALLPTEVPA